MNCERTMGAIYKRDKLRLIRYIIKFLRANYSFYEPSFLLAYPDACDIFSESVLLLLQKYPEIVEFNYQKSEKLLWAIIRNQIRVHMFKKAKEGAEKRGCALEFRLKYNEIQRKRDRKEYNRKQARKKYAKLKQDPIKYREYRERQNSYERNRQARKRSGEIDIDRRYFNPLRPLEKLKYA